MVSNQLSLFKSYFRVFSAQTFANVFFFFLILLELRVPKIRHTFLYFTLLVCLVLFNFQGPIFYTLNRLALARLSQVLCNYTTTFFVCQHLFLSFLKNFLRRFPNLRCALLLVALSLRLTHITTLFPLCQQVLSHSTECFISAVFADLITCTIYNVYNI